MARDHDLEERFEELSVSGDRGENEAAEGTPEGQYLWDLQHTREALHKALEEHGRLQAEIRDLRGLGWEHLKRERYPLIRAILESDAGP